MAEWSQGTGLGVENSAGSIPDLGSNLLDNSAPPPPPPLLCLRVVGSVSSPSGETKMNKPTKPEVPCATRSFSPSLSLSLSTGR